MNGEHAADGQLSLPFDHPPSPHGAEADTATDAGSAGERPPGTAAPTRDLHALWRGGVLAAADVHVTDAICRLTGEGHQDVRLAIALAVRAPRLGHVCLDLARLHDRGVEIETDTTAEVALPDPTVWQSALHDSRAIRGPNDDPARTAPLVLDGDRLYLDRYWRYESRLADGLRRLAAQRITDSEDPALRGALDRLFPPGDEEPDLQRRAAEIAGTRGLTVLSGGPGTGKTTTVVRLLATLLDARSDTPLRVVLAAPTGKAAARLGEAVTEALTEPWLDLAPEIRATLHDVPTMTLHRLLGFRPGSPSRFRHHARRPLPYDVVVVDEASMMSLPMAAKLVDAVRDGARLVLVGDRDQLASVEAGAVLSELCTPPASDGALSGNVVQLTRFHRFGPDSGIGAVARAVQRVDQDAGEVLELLEGRRTERGTGHGYDDVALHEPALEQALPETVLAGLLDGYRAVVDAAQSGAGPAEVLAAFDRQRLLCALRAGPQGVEAMNDHIGQELAGDGYRVTERFPLARPVMVTQNDYAVRLFNGDIGVVVPDPEQPDRRVVAFPAVDGGVRLLGTGRLPPHETVWAMSIHKSQGSQFGRVVVVLPDQPSPVLSRELVYTGVTRARVHADVVARRELLASALVRSVPRASGLGERLGSDHRE